MGRSVKVTEANAARKRMKTENEVYQLLSKMLSLTERMLSLNINDSDNDEEILSLQSEQQVLRLSLEEHLRQYPDYSYSDDQLELLQQGVRLEQELIKRLTPIYVEASYQLKNQQLPSHERKARDRYFSHDLEPSSYFIDQRR